MLDPGAGVKSWQVSARTLGEKGGWVSRARGTTQTAATVRLPRGHRYQLRLHRHRRLRPHHHLRPRQGDGPPCRERLATARDWRRRWRCSRAQSSPASPVRRRWPARPNPTHQKSIDRIVAFLEEHQLESGGYADTGTKPTQSISAWVTLALAAAGINPLDQTRFVNGVPCGHSALEYLDGHFAEGVHEELAWPQIATTAFERELLVVDTAGHRPARLRRLRPGRRDHRPPGCPTARSPTCPAAKGRSTTRVFGILALAPVKEPEAEAAVGAATDWLQARGQDADGGFNWRAKGSASEVDLTGAAIEALVAAGDARATEAEADGARLPPRSAAARRRLPRAAAGPKRESNVASTAWARAGDLGLRRQPGNLADRRSGAGEREPLDYMESMQQPDGHIRWRGEQRPERDLDDRLRRSRPSPGRRCPIALVAPRRAERPERAAELRRSQGGAGSADGQRTWRRQIRRR